MFDSLEAVCFQTTTILTL